LRQLAFLLLIVTIAAQAGTIQRVEPPLTEGVPIVVSMPEVQRIRAAVANRSICDVRGPSSLDDVFCTFDFAPLEFPVSPDLTSLDSGVVLSLWVRGDGCPQCDSLEPIRIEAFIPLLIRPDGSPADTLDFEVEVRCAVAGSDPCSGLGNLRATRTAQLVFERNQEDGQVEISIPTVFFDGVLADSNGAFLSVRSLGTRTGSTVFLASEQNSRFPIDDCRAWLSRDSVVEWNSLWEPEHGGPIVSVGWSCDLADSLVVPPCPESCSFARFGGPQAYFDPFTNTVYQWIAPAPSEFPIAPQSLELKLYFEALGAETDRAYFRVLFACAGFGDICCPPSEPLCTISAHAERDSPFQTVLDVHVPLSQIECCLDEPFWLGVVVDSVTSGATLPSFLYSSATVDPAPPMVCEQWTGSSGRLTPVRQDDVAWADLRLTATCGSCFEAEPLVCVPEANTLDCSGATFVACAEDGVILVSQSIDSGNGMSARYCCSDLGFPGGELVYRMQIPNQGNLRVQATVEALEHVALFLFETCDAQNCVAYGVDSLRGIGLTNGEYFVVVESFGTGGQQVDLTFVCIADCNNEICIADLRGSGGIGNRYLDGEGDGRGEMFFQSYYPGTGRLQQILRFNAMTCDSLSPITWQTLESVPSRMLAYDPRNGGEYWCGTTTDFFGGTGRLYRLSSGGGVVQSWTTIAGLPIMRWSGAAFDPTHNHMWVFIRDSSNTGNSRAFELDLSNPQQPVVIQGPHLLPHQSPNSSLSSGGADYAHLANHLLVVHQGSPEDFVQCYEDLDPGYSGPRPGPGFVPVAWCSPDSNSLQGYSIAAIEDSGGGKIAMTNFTDTEWGHPVTIYPPPCRLAPPRCLAPDNLTIVIEGATARLSWTAIYPGVYDIYSSVNPDNDGNPDGGQDTLFELEVSLPLSAGAASWQDEGEIAEYKVYTIVLTCASQDDEANRALNSEYNR